MMQNTYPVFSATTGETSYITETVGDFIQPVLTADDIRKQRDTMLSASDWTQVADAPVDKAAWAIYRQALRDVPTQVGFPDNVVWPIQP